MVESGIALLDWLGIVAFTTTGALAASRNQMDAVGFVLLGTVTGIGGGTLRDILLDAHPILWIEHPVYLAVCVGVSLGVFFTAHIVHKRFRLILWLDAVGLALFATVGAERAVSTGAAPIVAVIMGVITASFGGIIRDVLSQQRSVIFSHEIYVTAAMAAALAYVVLEASGAPREAAIIGGNRQWFRPSRRRACPRLVIAALPCHARPSIERRTAGRLRETEGIVEGGKPGTVTGAWVNIHLLNLYPFRPNLTGCDGGGVVSERRR